MKGYAFDRASVLLVDDSVWMRAVLRQMLKALGFTRVTEADSGVAALNKLEALQPDVILTDWDMQPLNGLDLTRRIRRLPGQERFTPIIMISAYSRLSNVLAARNAGVSEFLVKPLSPQALYHRLAAVIERPRPFIEAPNYIGPDRRRQGAEGYLGRKRRQSDQGPVADGGRRLPDVPLTQEDISDIMSCTRTPQEVCG
ncbi:response regulator [Azospirillum canadense]|uniref:response regulator n=1 Tax=Azospirillum canadense TaxID=403962 RepID=UPI0022268F45|nr:response regulator [Azospirillum canadense]MCW2239485.1 CheY-like chemotaxis protein [Azospirillum canadense]